MNDKTPLSPEIDLADQWRKISGYVMWTFGPLTRAMPTLHADDILSAAALAFTETVQGFPAFCAEIGKELFPGLFHNRLKMAARWAVLAIVKEAKEQDSTSIDEADPSNGNDSPQTALWTSINAAASTRQHSMLQGALADVYASMTLQHRIILALVCFEELAADEVGLLIGKDRANVYAYATLAAEEFLLRALDQAADSTAPRRRLSLVHTPPDALEAWVRKHYGVGVSVWLQYVVVCFREDVSYLVEILDRAYGRGPRRGMNGANNPRKGPLTPDQVREIRQRILAGDAQREIATDFGISEPTVSFIKSGKRYGWVA